MSTAAVQSAPRWFVPTSIFIPIALSMTALALEGGGLAFLVPLSVATAMSVALYKGWVEESSQNTVVLLVFLLFLVREIGSWSRAAELENMTRQAQSFCELAFDTSPTSCDIGEPDDPSSEVRIFP